MPLRLSCNALMMMRKRRTRGEWLWWWCEPVLFLPKIKSCCSRWATIESRHTESRDDSPVPRSTSSRRSEREDVQIVGREMNEISLQMIGQRERRERDTEGDKNPMIRIWWTIRFSPSRCVFMWSTCFPLICVKNEYCFSVMKLMQRNITFSLCVANSPKASLKVNVALVLCVAEVVVAESVTVLSF